MFDSHVPAPPEQVRWKDMKPGDSILVRWRSQASLGNCAREAFGKGNYRTRTEGDAIRVWRLA